MNRRLVEELLFLGQTALMLLMIALIVHFCPIFSRPTPLPTSAPAYASQAPGPIRVIPAAEPLSYR